MKTSPLIKDAQYIFTDPRTGSIDTITHTGYCSDDTYHFLNYMEFKRNGVTIYLSQEDITTLTPVRASNYQKRLWKKDVGLHQRINFAAWFPASAYGGWPYRLERLEQAIGWREPAYYFIMPPWQWV